MLSSTSQLFGALEEILATSLNYQTARLRSSRKNRKASSTSETQELLRSACPRIDPNNALLRNMVSYFKNNDFEYATIVSNSKRSPLTLQTSVEQLNVCNKGPVIFGQKRGFRTRAARKEEEKSNENSFLSFLLGLKKDQTKLSNDVRQMVENADPKLKKKIKIAFAEGYLSGRERQLKRFPYGWIISFSFIGAMVLFIYFRLGKIQFKFVSSINQVAAEDVKVTFNDVKGIEEAKEELMLVVEYLKDPTKFTSLGGRLPKGVLLVGSPGSGKTLLAKAIAGEAGVPFFRASGSEFEEMYVGLGAKRVRDLFAVARSHAPCVLFIDEIDSVGSKRSYSPYHPYANQTINQLLTEMDGFSPSAGVIVLAATNRRKDLDKALTRPGRFDVEISVPRPDMKGRKEIYQLYLSKVKYDPDVDVEKLAKRSVGMSGADIENVINQAALKAAADNKTSVNMHYLDIAYDQIKMGLAWKQLPGDKETNENTAYHEAGHAIVAHFTKGADSLHKVTILPRGLALGHTSFTPEKELYGRTKQQLTAQLDVAMGGRAAEELCMGPEKVTTGVMNDLESATVIAQSMVANFGMSDRVGLRFFSNKSHVSDAATESVDQEVRRLLNESYERAKNIIKNHSAAHKRLADALLQHETLNAEEIKLILEGESLTKG